MAFLDHSISIADLPVSNNNFEVLPAGWYGSSITGAELKSTKAGTGQYIAVKYNITGPTHQGRIIFGNLNIRNPNPTAEEIGRQQLGDLMRSIGLVKVDDTDQLIGGNLQIKMGIKEAVTKKDPSTGLDIEVYPASNEVKGWRVAGDANNNYVSPSSSQPSVQKAAPPWAKK